MGHSLDECIGLQRKQCIWFDYGNKEKEEGKRKKEGGEKMKRPWVNRRWGPTENPRSQLANPARGTWIDEEARELDSLRGEVDITKTKIEPLVHCEASEKWNHSEKRREEKRREEN
jgi:hypothetical protein